MPASSKEPKARSRKHKNLRSRLKRSNEFSITEYTGSQIADDPKLKDAILDLDKTNMEAVLQASGVQSFPWERRINGLLDESTRVFIASTNSEFVSGYIEYCRDFNDKSSIYLSSLQIKQIYRSGCLFRHLVASAFFQLKSEQFNFLNSNVQKTNIQMIQIFKKIGFDVVEDTNHHTLKVKGSLEIISKSKFLKKIVSR